MNSLKYQILLFIQGLCDSLNVYTSYKHYTSSNDKNSQKIKSNLGLSLYSSITCLIIMFIVDWTKRILTIIHLPTLLSNIIIYPIILLFYVQNIVRQVIYISKIVDSAITLETETFKETSYYVYTLKDKKLESASFFEQINLALRAFLFSIILLTQTILIDLIYLILPSVSLIFHIDNYFYSVYLTVGFLALKIPYQDHLPYYFHKHIMYLAGYSIIIAYFLNSFLAFPNLGIVFSIMTPYFLLGAFYTDPPHIEQYELKSFSQNLIEILTFKTQRLRNSYKNHLVQYNQNKDYKKQAEEQIGWFSIPKILRPYALRGLQPGMKLFTTFYSRILDPIFKVLPL